MQPRAFPNVSSRARPFILILVATLALLILQQSTVLRAQGAWPSVELLEPITGFAQPVFIGHANDGSGRLFVVEQPGRIRIVRDGKLLATPFLDITGRVLCCGERGLLGLAFAPDYNTSGWFYVYYTARAGDGDITVSRFRRGAAADNADPTSEQILLTIEHSSESNHNGGMLAFGPRDNYLYIGTGDGGSGDDPPNNAQNRLSLLGKLLRIDVSDPPTAPPAATPTTNPQPPATPVPSSAPSPNAIRRYLPLAQAAGSTAPAADPSDSRVMPAQATYRIPPSNPFVGRSGYRPEIWALGLRNPWRFSFDRQTGDLFIADVGQGAWEEIDLQPAAHTGGVNYGWRIVEGPACNTRFGTGCDLSKYTAPVAWYGRSEGRSITGGYMYRGTRTPALAGIYLFADFATGSIFGLRRQGDAWSRETLGEATAISTFGEDQSGEVYAAEYGGTIYRVGTQ